MVASQQKKHKLYSEDIKMVFMKTIRKIPQLPHFAPLCKNYEEDTEESNLTQQ